MILKDDRISSKGLMDRLLDRNDPNANNENEGSSCDEHSNTLSRTLSSNSQKKSISSNRTEDDDATEDEAEELPSHLKKFSDFKKQVPNRNLNGNSGLKGLMRFFENANSSESLSSGLPSPSPSPSPSPVPSNSHSSFSSSSDQNLTMSSVATSIEPDSEPSKQKQSLNENKNTLDDGSSSSILSRIQNNANERDTSMITSTMISRKNSTSSGLKIDKNLNKRLREFANQQLKEIEMEEKENRRSLLNRLKEEREGLQGVLDMSMKES